jgi:MFS family permease
MGTMGFASNIPKLYLLRALFWMHFFAAVLVPFYTDWGGIPLSRVLFLNAWFMFWNFALEVPTGAVADRLGRKASVAAGFAVAAAAALVYTSRPGFGTFLLAEAVFAAAYTLLSGADEALAYDSLLAAGRETEAKKTLARMESFKLAGILAAVVAGSFIAARWGLRAPMRAYVFPAAAGFLLALTLREPPSHGAREGRPSYRAVITGGLAYFRGHGILLRLTAEMALTNALAWAIIWLYQPLLARAGLPIAWFGTVHAATVTGQILFLSGVERWEAGLGSKRAVLVWGGAAAGAAFAALAFLRSTPWVVAAIVMAFTFGLTRPPLFSAYLNRHIPSDKRATVLSVASMFRTLGIVVMNPLIGLSADRSLTGTMLWLGIALAGLSVFSRIEERDLAG